jgi:hypothetical protein
MRFSTNVLTPDVIDNSINIQIKSGYYDETTLISAINLEITNAGFVGCVLGYDPITMKISITLDSSPTYNSSIVYRTDIVFFDSGDDIFLSDNFNQTLGWSLGFRNISYNTINKIIGEAVLNTQGTKYLVLSIDDFNQNHINNGLVSITEPSRYIKVPEYVLSSNMIGTTMYGTSMEQDAELARQSGNNIINVADKTGNSYKLTPVIVGLEPTGKQTLTQTQMYTANQILKNNSITTTYRTSAPTTPDVLAVIPIKPGPIGSIYVEFGGTVQDNKRVYFGPVNIERFKVRLYTDKGVLLNLNGMDWSITIIAEMLYQY